MKSINKILLTVAIMMVVVTGFAQQPKYHYQVSGGLLGALNFSKFKVTDAPSIEYKNALGYAYGVWLNFPMGHTFSLEAQAQSSTLNYNLTAGSGLFDGKLQYYSFPVVMKLHLGSKLALMGGPQFDFLNKMVKDDNSNGFWKSQFTAKSTGWTAGLELFPRNAIQLYGRYFNMGTDMDGRQGNPNVKAKFYNQGFQAGLKWKLFGKKIVAPVPVVVAPVVPVDTDGDGINDDVDKCPTVAGLAKYGGCPVPDTDGDGINDENDKCPTVKGLAKYQGCPVPDTDKDGINDENDKCPTVPGVAKYQGCPIPDTDGDGINDEEDLCPTEVGTAANKGCPDLSINLKEIAKSIYFVTGTSKFAYPKKAPNKIASIVDVMNKYPALKLSIEGHTDITGSAKLNQSLSEKRAAAILKYLTEKGIDAGRLTSVGYGATKPVATNKTAAGRQLNRRTELIPSF